MHLTDLTDLTDDALVSRLSTLCLEGHALTARLILHLIEVEERRLDLRAACTSMFDFCQRRLGMSEGAAFRRINAARLVKRFPSLLERIETGRAASVDAGAPQAAPDGEERRRARRGGRWQDAASGRGAPRAARAEAGCALGDRRARRARERGGAYGSFADAAAPPRPAPRAPRARIEPLSEARYKVQLTAGAELKAKLERACDLMRHRNPTGDLAPVIDAALELLLAKLEKERLGKVKTPREPGSQGALALAASHARGPRRGAPRGLRARRRAVHVRRATTGARCPSRGHLELDHIEPRALGGRMRRRTCGCAAARTIACMPSRCSARRTSQQRVDFRQRKSRAVARRTSLSPPPPSPHVFEVALRGLQNMGFAKTEARRAVDHVSRASRRERRRARRAGPSPRRDRGSDVSFRRTVKRPVDARSTPKRVSWLKMVQIEVGVMASQCLDRRSADPRQSPA